MYENHSIGCVKESKEECTWRVTFIDDRVYKFWPIKYYLSHEWLYVILSKTFVREFINLMVQTMNHRRHYSY